MKIEPKNQLQLCKAEDLQLNDVFCWHETPESESFSSARWYIARVSNVQDFVIEVNVLGLNIGEGWNGLNSTETPIFISLKSTHPFYLIFSEQNSMIYIYRCKVCDSRQEHISNEVSVPCCGETMVRDYKSESAGATFKGKGWAKKEK